ncbi:hypothetical protein HK102_005129 [Quaeritorhiza haematococci]|nr:hypothetical protein HK102_005129 [Quaeritorhiza haematococci]
MTKEDQIRVVHGLENMLSLYVNRDWKIHNYGADADPIPGIKEISNILNTDAPKIPDDKFHKDIALSFLRSRDLHTVYQFPRPYRCYTAVWPLAFALVESDDLVGNPQAAVKSLPRQELRDRFPSSSLSQISIGDVLVSINGLTVKELYEKFKHVAAGANTFGGHRSVLGYFTYRSATHFLLPDEDEVTYVLRRTKHGETYTVTFPIAVESDEKCLEPPPQEQSPPPSQPESDERTPIRIKQPKRLDLASVHQQPIEGMKRIFGADIFPPPTSNETAPRYPTAEPAIQWSLYRPGRGVIGLEGSSSMKEGPVVGVIHLKHFSPWDVDRAVLLIRGLLINQFKDTEGVIFDVRSNPGGIIAFAEKIPQLFSVPGDAKPAVPMGMRALNTPLNEKLFTGVCSDWEPGWRELFDQDNDSRYTKPLPIVSEYAVNLLGQAYFKPTAVLMNSWCYSSCDMFSAAMQDIGAAIIFGEDPQTGAGGANVWDYSLLHDCLPDDLPSLREEGINPNIAFRQLIRNGKNAGELIEDVGVVADFVVRPQVSDLEPGKTSWSNWDRIASQLERLGRNSWTRFNAEPQLEASFPIGTYPTFNIHASWLTRIELFLNNLNGTQTLVGRLDIPKTRQLRSYTLKSDRNAVDTLEVRRYSIVGYVNDGSEQTIRKVFETHRYVRGIPAVTDALPIDWNRLPMDVLGFWKNRGQSGSLGTANSRHSQHAPDVAKFTAINDRYGVMIRAANEPPFPERPLWQVTYDGGNVSLGVGTEWQAADTSFGFFLQFPPLKEGLQPYVMVKTAYRDADGKASGGKLALRAIVHEEGEHDVGQFIDLEVGRKRVREYVLYETTAPAETETRFSLTNVLNDNMGQDMRWTQLELRFDFISTANSASVQASVERVEIGFNS